MKVISGNVLLLLLLFSCSNQPKKPSSNEPLTKQYLLTNAISIKNRDVVYGASSYLVELKGVTYLCTAKHLTTEAMGFTPDLDLKTVNDSLVYWKAYARNDHFTNDTIAVQHLQFSNTEDDIILFRLKEQPTEIGILQPRSSTVPKDEKLRILGCEYVDADCYQKEYKVTAIGYSTDYGMTLLEVVFNGTTVDFSGFSGAPVLDNENLVVGHLQGALKNGKITRLFIVPITSAKKIS